jgi:hypothetical protein
VHEVSFYRKIGTTVVLQDAQRIDPYILDSEESRNGNGILEVR